MEMINLLSARGWFAGLLVIMIAVTLLFALILFIALRPIKKDDLDDESNAAKKLLEKREAELTIALLSKQNDQKETEELMGQLREVASAGKLINELMGDNKTPDEPVKKGKAAKPAKTAAPAKAEDKKPEVKAEQPAKAEDSKPEAKAEQPAKAEDKKPEAKAEQPAKAEDKKPEAKAEQPAKAEESKPEVKAEQPAKAEESKPEAKAEQPAKAEESKPEAKAEQPAKTEKKKK